MRNFGSSLGLAVLGTILILENKANLESTLGAQGVPKAQADQIADSISQGSSAGSEGFAETAGAHAQQLFAAVQHDFALASRTVFYAMAGVMVVAFVVALICDAGRQGGRASDRGRGRALAGATLCGRGGATTRFTLQAGRWYVGHVTVWLRRFALTIATLVLLGLPVPAAAATSPAQRLIDAYAPITMLREEQDPPCETSAEQYEPTSVSTVLGNPSVDPEAGRRRRRGKARQARAHCC